VTLNAIKILLCYAISFAQAFYDNKLSPSWIRQGGPSAVRGSLAKTEAKKTAKKQGKGTGKGSPTFGFGGAAKAPCPCGQGKEYMKCCGLIHIDLQAFVNAKAEQVVRARYAAYSNRNVDFIMASTHPENESNYMADVEHWKKTIRENCYDEYELMQCVILDEEYHGEGSDEEATVKFIARLVNRVTREKSAFMEISKFKRLIDGESLGGWLYLSGEVEQVNVVDVDQQQFDDKVNK